MTEWFFEELHALRQMKDKGYIVDKDITAKGYSVIERLLKLKLCAKKVSGMWYWKKDIYEMTLAGMMRLSEYDLLIGSTRRSIATRISNLKNKSKVCIRDKTEEVIKENGMNLLSFLTLEMILRSKVFAIYQIGEIQFQHVKVHFAEYLKETVLIQDVSKYNLSYLDDDDTKICGNTDYAYELLYWELVLGSYISYQEDVNPEAIPVGETFDGYVEDTPQIVEENNSHSVSVSEPVVESSSNTECESTSSYGSSDSSSSYDSGSSDSGSCSSD